MPFLGRTPTQLVDPEVDINGGAIDGTAIGASSAAAGTFTNLTATGTLTLPDDGISGDDVNGGTISNFASTGIDDNATSTAITIDSSQNVGIGTASPTANLEISAATSRKIDVVDTTGARVRLSTASGQTYVGSTTAHPLNIITSDAIRATVDASGNVGIGQSSPATKLHVAGQVGGVIARFHDNIAANCYIEGSGSVLRFANRAGNGQLGFTVNNGGSDAVRIDNSGNLLVGTTSQIGTSRFSSVATGNNTPISGQNGATVTTVPLFNLYSNVGGTGTLRFQIQADGDAFNSNNSYGALSDERLKSNIVDASSQLDDIMAVQVRSYTLNATGDTHIGVVAQELEASGMSGLVKENQEGMKAVKYSVLYMKALKALQEAVTRIETLEAEVALLKGAN